MGIELNNEGSSSVRFSHCYSSGSVRVRLILCSGSVRFDQFYGSGSVRVRLMSGSEFLIHKRILQFWVWFGYK